MISLFNDFTSGYRDKILLIMHWWICVYNVFRYLGTYGAFHKITPYAPLLICMRMDNLRWEIFCSTFWRWKWFELNCPVDLSKYQNIESLPLVFCLISPFNANQRSGKNIDFLGNMSPIRGGGGVEYLKNNWLFSDKM